MNLSHKICSSVVLGAALAVATLALTAPAVPIYTQTTEVTSAAGRITAVQGNTFTLDPSKRDTSSHDRSEKTLTLTVDQDTDVHGKIAVGAEANVTYRREDGNNVAVSVRIVQQSS